MAGHWFDPVQGVCFLDLMQSAPRTSPKARTILGIGFTIQALARPVANTVRSNVSEVTP